ncbi:hypothetical protein LDENG_00104630 [Lucifuga dentata]|nr:hypothetical protein LDENG_00104630 [Lucifuga dentata]
MSKAESRSKQGCSDFKRASSQEVVSSTKPEKMKKKSRRNLNHRQDTRVAIGTSFGRWRSLKKRNGLKSDADVAHYLLDDMKRSFASCESSDQKMRISKSEVQMLIEQEVDAAKRQNENMLEYLVEKIQQVENELSFQSAINKLEARINRVERRGDAALAYITSLKPNKTKDNTQNPLPSFVPVMLDISRSDSEEEVTEVMLSSDRKSTKKSHEFLQTMEDTKVAIKKMQADNKALKSTIIDLCNESPPRLTSTASSLQVSKKESPNCWQSEDEAEEVKEEKQKVKVERLSRDNSKNFKSSESEQELSYPPLPSNSFPSTLNMEAASYSIPQRVSVQLALIRNPPGLYMRWNVEKEEPAAPPMDSYSIYMTVEKPKGSGIFLEWKSLHVVKASKLPMCVEITKYKPGYKVCFAVVGKDKFGRYGPYSKVVPAIVPD